MVECTIRRNPRQAAAPQGAADPLAPPMSPTSPTSPTSTVSDADTVFSRYGSNSLALTVVPPDLISKYESDFYYHGLSGSPPPLTSLPLPISYALPLPPPLYDRPPLSLTPLHLVQHNLRLVNHLRLDLSFEFQNGNSPPATTTTTTTTTTMTTMTTGRRDTCL